MSYTYLRHKSERLRVVGESEWCLPATRKILHELLEVLGPGGEVEKNLERITLIIARLEEQDDLNRAIEQYAASESPEAGKAKQIPLPKTTPTDNVRKVLPVVVKSRKYARVQIPGPRGTS